MRMTSGNLYPITLQEAGVQLDVEGRDRRYLEVTTESSLKLFDKIAVLNGDVNADMLGVFSRLTIGRDLKARFGSFSTPRHILSSRKNGCTWNPKGRIRLNIDEIDSCPVEYNGEQCPDAFWGNCLERIFGVGNDVHDLMGTPEGQGIVAMLLRQVYIALGNSFYEMVHFANHPMIETANTLGFWQTKTNAADWADFYDQMTSVTCAGIITLVDELAAEGQPGFDIDIPDDEFDSAGNYTGDIRALFEKLMSRARGPFRIMTVNGAGSGAGKVWPIFLVTDALYRAYEEYIMTQFSTLPQAYNYQLLRNDGSILTMPNVLMYKGMPVMRWEASAVFDEVVGSTSHRAALIAPGVFGIAYDVADLQQYSGMGLRLIQKLDSPWKGKIFMDTTFRWGAGLADLDYIVYASNLKHPS